MSTLATRRSIIQDVRLLLAAADTGNKDHRSRMAQYLAWVEADGRGWLEPDLAAWRDELATLGYAPASVGAYLSSVRAAYARLIGSAPFRDALYRQVRASGLTGPSDQKAFVDEIVARIESCIDARAAPVRQIVHQDRPEAMHLRLTKGQAEALLAAPGLSTLRGLRDTALIALLLCTGIREAELCSLDVADLRQQLGGELALYVRQGKGDKARLVPYGDLDWCLAIAERWLVLAGIQKGPVFRGFYKGGRRLRRGRLTARAVEMILASYPITANGRPIRVRPHDCRRTYARRLYEAGAELVAIQQNLGHVNLETTLGYIGELDAERRRAPAVYTFDLGRLEDAPRRLI